MPCEIRPPQRFSRKDMTANPTICAQQPASAAPPAIPVSPSAAQIAAEEIGSVNAMPTMTETKIPINNGCKLVAHIIKLPSFMAAAPSAGAHHADNATPTPIVTSGVTKISTAVPRRRQGRLTKIPP